MCSIGATERVPPIIAVVGASKSGKTTLIEALIASLTSRGYRVATIKHAPGKSSFDQRHKDSWRHIQAGSAATLLVSVRQTVLIRSTAHELTLEEAVRFLDSGYDIVLIEGFKKSHVPKIKVCKGIEDSSTFDLTNLIALVSEKPVEGEIKCFSPGEIDQLTDFLEENFLDLGERRNRRGKLCEDSP